MLGCCESALAIFCAMSLQVPPPPRPPPLQRNCLAAKDGTWRFAVSGDSRNCGDVVMPAHRRRRKEVQRAPFYWHLGDFRAIYDFDEDMQHQPQYIAKPLTISQYLTVAWDDFIQSQIVPFGTTPVFLGIGNHDTTPPKTREQFFIQFADWLNQPVLQKQRLSDDPHARKLTTYFHWIQAGVDFISLDNATPDQFDFQQMAWFEKTLQLDFANPQIHTIVVGMHEALPDSISENHSMDQFANGTESGRRVYVGSTESAERRAQTRLRPRQPLALLHGRNFQHASTGASTAESFPDGSSAPPEPFATPCRRKKWTRKPPRQTFTAFCSAPSNPDGEINFHFSATERIRRARRRRGHLQARIRSLVLRRKFRSPLAHTKSQEPTHMTTAPEPANVTPEHIFETLNAYQKTAALKAAIELDVFSAIAAGATTHAAIAKRCQTSERGMRILCDYLVINGFLIKNGRTTRLPTIPPFFSISRSPAYIGSAAELSRAARNDESLSWISPRSCAPAPR